MNEPSVFSGPETTLPKSAMHTIYIDGSNSRYKTVSHGEVHNAYGLMMAKATFDGVLNR